MPEVLLIAAYVSIALIVAVCVATYYRMRHPGIDKSSMFFEVLMLSSLWPVSIPFIILCVVLVNIGKLIDYISAKIAEALSK